MIVIGRRIGSGKALHGGIQPAGMSHQHTYTVHTLLDSDIRFLISLNHSRPFRVAMNIRMNSILQSIPSDCRGIQPAS